MATDMLATERTSEHEQLDARCAQWIDDMSNGHQQALNDLYDATLSRVYAVAIRMLGEPLLAEGIVTEAYHEAWTKASTYDAQRGRPITWLLTICRNRALDELRRQTAMARKTEAATLMSVEPDVDEPDQLLEATQTGHTVHMVLATLSPDDRQLIALAFFKGLTHQEIATLVDLPLGTVKSRIRRALGSLNAAFPQEYRSH